MAKYKETDVVRVVIPDANDIYNGQVGVITRVYQPIKDEPAKYYVMFDDNKNVMFGKEQLVLI